MSASKTGLKDFIIQRLTAIYMAFYLIFLFAYLAFHPHFHFEVWQGFFHLVWVQVLSIIFLLCMMWHAWVGVWTILTDYVKIPVLRMLIQSLVILALIIFFFWGFQIVWGIKITWGL